MDWNRLYVEHPEFCIEDVAEEVTDFLPFIEKIPGMPKDKKIYDLGFGAGRHILYFARLGYQVFGDDISESGKRITEEKLKKE